jgi:Uma2 family endonuclease
LATPRLGQGRAFFQRHWRSLYGRLREFWHNPYLNAKPGRAALIVDDDAMSLSQSDASYSISEYLTLERESSDRHEYVDGLIYLMAGESEEHGMICQNLAGQLYVQLRGKACQTFSKDMKVRSGPEPRSPRSVEGFFSYPDVVVVCGERRYHDEYHDVLLNPVVIIEVLSPSTKDYDRGEKFERYRTWLPSLAEYVIVHQSQPQIEHHRRHSEEQWLLTTISGLDATVPVSSIGCEFKLSDIYEGVSFPPKTGLATP